MKRTTILIILAAGIVANVFIFAGTHYWRIQKQSLADEMIRKTERYAGATGPSIEGYDKNIDHWLAEMEEESIEVILQKLTDAAEWECGIHGAPMHSGLVSLRLEETELEKSFILLILKPS